MERKEMYTLQELYNELEIPISALARKGNMNEGTATRIRDGYPARQSTINKLLRAFSEVYGIHFTRANVSDIKIEDKHPSVEAKKQPVTVETRDHATPTVTSPLLPSTETKKRAYTKQKEKKSTLPEGAMLATEFGIMHGVKRETFRDHMNRGLGPGLIHGPEVPEDGSILVRDYVRYEERNKRVKKDGTIEKERYLTPEQQLAAIEFWKRHDVSFTMPDTEQEAAAADDRPWYTPE